MKSPTKKVARPTAKMSQLVSNIQSTFEVDAKTIDLKRKINEGNFGTVWLAVWKRKEMGDMEVAVKQMKARGKKEMEDLKNELPLLFRAASHCNNVCKLHGITELDGKLSIIMTYYSGGNIGEYMVDYKKRKGENLPWGKIRKFCLAVCRGMQELHDNRIVVQDLKCDNILLDKYETAHIADFGVSKSLKSNGCCDCEGGTPNFMAPEHIKGAWWETYGESDVLLCTRTEYRVDRIVIRTVFPITTVCLVFVVPLSRRNSRHR